MVSYSDLASAPPIRRQSLSEAHMAPYVNANACDACKNYQSKSYYLLTAIRSIPTKAVPASAYKICDITVESIEPQNQALDDEMLYMKLANTDGTPYCQDQVWI